MSNTVRQPGAGVTRRAAISGAVGAAAITTLGGRQPAAAQSATPTAAAPNSVVASWPRVFTHSGFQFQFLIGIGGAFEQATDIGEMFAMASNIKDGDFDSWFDAFTAMGDRLRGIGETSLAGGNPVSAREAFLRASSYYAQAYFFALGTKQPDRLMPTWEQHHACWDQFAALLTPAAEAVTIPYENTTLPGYVLLVDDSGAPRPWVIMTNGSDGTMTDMWVQGGAAALRRGYNVLLYDGPGQGAALWRQKLYFRPDWEKVLTPVVDYLLTRPDVDPGKLFTIGISQGGFWVPRAIAFEKRLLGAVADPGVMDVATSWTSQMPPDTMAGLTEAPEAEREKIAAEINEGVQQGMDQSADFRWLVEMRTAPYGVAKFSDMLALLAQYNLRDVVGQITTPLLIADPEGEQFWPGQSQELYDAVTGPKELVHFTAAEGADLHCEPKANGLRAQVFFDWFNTLMNPEPAATPTA